MVEMFSTPSTDKVSPSSLRDGRHPVFTLSLRDGRHPERREASRLYFMRPGGVGKPGMGKPGRLSGRRLRNEAHVLLSRPWLFHEDLETETEKAPP